ncbi:MAG: CRISPR-associated helicase/endonuclease Cas3 [Gammaproteobacteria bacterium]
MKVHSGCYGAWGKAGQEVASGAHLLVYHALDVAACGAILLRHLPRWRRRLERLTGLSGDRLETLVTVYLAIHDLGKFATGFQSLRPDLLQRLRPGTATRPYVARHDTLGYLLWKHHLRDRLTGAGRRRRRGSPAPAIDAWMRAVTGHHGQPPGENVVNWKDAFEEGDFHAAEAFVRALLHLTGLDALPSPPAETAAISSWWIAGLAVLADWLGSNRDFFAYHADPMPLPDYWQRALGRAEEAIRATGLANAEPARRFGLSDCFAEPPTGLRHSPLQDWAQRTRIAPGPSLFILEDVTGAGKTEAALLLAWRLLQADEGTGVYFGLPTMATANAMYGRLGGGEPPVYARLFESRRPPSLVLAHGRADQVDAFLASILPTDPDEADYGDGTLPAGPCCNAWLADNRKKALLAEVGVGTIDQVLLGVLPARHQSLRLLGLLGKVLVVDEVHACDVYMNSLLAQLLTAHAKAGGSAILLSATLPHGQKRRLIEAFARGAGYELPELPQCRDYPLATRLDTDGIVQGALATRPEVARRVEVRFIEERDAAEALMEKLVEEGRCACWVCNTVDEARQRYQWLSQRRPEWQIELFHARFTLHDRLRIEQRVLRHFGKDSGAEERRGRILIATQVVEQSLDLDFDDMISDLAPIDLIIQRAGRLRRHARDEQGNRVDGPDRRGTPILTLLAPSWEEEPGPRWLRDALPGTAAVYREEDGRLWLAMKQLRGLGGFEMPTHARALVEAVYGADPFDDIPEGLRSQALAADGKARAQRSFAALKKLPIDEEGYAHTGPWLDEESAPTRLGEPTTTLWLARWQEDCLLPLHDDNPDEPDAWLRSSLTVRQSLVAGDIFPPGVTLDEWAEYKRCLPGKGKWGVVMILHEKGQEWIGHALDAEKNVREWRYSPQTGLATHIQHKE